MIYDNLTGSIQTVRDRLLAWPSNSSLPLTFNITRSAAGYHDGDCSNTRSTNALPAVATPFNQFGWYYDPHLKNHYSTQYNLEVQKQLNSSLVATVGYVGSYDRNLPVTGIANDSPEPGGAGLDRPFPWSGTAIMATSRGAANYNAFQARVRQAPSARVFHSGPALPGRRRWTMVEAAFTELKTGHRVIRPFENYYDISANYGISGNSLKFIYYGWGLYELPFGKGKPYLSHGIASQVLGGWQANTNISAHSGVPLGFPDAGQDPANIGNTSFYNYARANVTGSPKVGHPTKVRLSIPRSFQIP